MFWKPPVRMARFELVTDLVERCEADAGAAFEACPLTLLRWEGGIADRWLPLTLGTFGGRLASALAEANLSATGPFASPCLASVVLRRLERRSKAVDWKSIKGAAAVVPASAAATFSDCWALGLSYCHAVGCFCM